MNADPQHSTTPAKGGAPIANKNAVRHGLTTGSLPTGCAYVVRSTNELRATLENAVIELRNEVSLYDAAIINTAVRWERHALLAQRWLRLEADKMDASIRLSYSRDVARASAERDKCLKSLGVDVRPGSDPWAALDALPHSPPTPSGNGHDHATDDATDDETSDSAADGHSAVDAQSDATDDPTGDGGRDDA